MNDEQNKPWSQREQTPAPAGWAPPQPTPAEKGEPARTSASTADERTETETRSRSKGLLIAAPLLVVASAAGGWVWSHGQNSTTAATTSTSTASIVTSNIVLPSTVAPNTTIGSTSKASSPSAASVAPVTAASSTITPATSSTVASSTTAATKTLVLDQAPTEKLPGGQPWPSGLYADGKMHMKGALPSRKDADGVMAKAAAIIGKENVLDEMTIDPTVPLVHTVIVRLGNPILFEPNSTILKADSNVGFDQWGAFLKTNPTMTLTILGHTDDRGTAEANNDLAQRRATAAMDRVLSNGIDPSRVSVMSRGSSDPIADNSTDAGRALNRRIEIAVTGLFG